MALHGTLRHIMATRRKTAAKKKTAKTGAKASAKAKAAPKKKVAAKAAKVAKAPKKAKAKAKAPAKAAPKAAPKKVIAKSTAKKTNVGRAVNAAKAAPKAGKSKATYLGRADALNASISLLAVDAAAAAEPWKSVDPDDLDAIEAATNKVAKLGNGLDNGKARTFKLGSSTGVGFQLRVGKGIAHVFRAGKNIVVAEGFVDDVERPEFLDYVAGAPSKGAVDGGTLDAASGVLALMIPGGAYEDLPTRIKNVTTDSGARIGSETPGLLVKVSPGRYRVLVEPETKGTFGEAARAVLQPA